MRVFLCSDVIFRAIHSHLWDDVSLSIMNQNMILILFRISKFFSALPNPYFFARRYSGNGSNSSKNKAYTLLKLYVGWSKKALLRKWCFSQDLKAEKELKKETSWGRRAKIDDRINENEFMFDAHWFVVFRMRNL